MLLLASQRKHAIAEESLIIVNRNQCNRHEACNVVLGAIDAVPSPPVSSEEWEMRGLERTERVGSLTLIKVTAHMHPRGNGGQDDFKAR